MKPIRKTSDVKHIVDFLTHSDMTKTILAHTLGVSESGLAKWLRAGEAPLWTLPAIDGLQRRAEAQIENHFLLIRPGEHRRTILAFLAALKIDFTNINI